MPYKQDLPESVWDWAVPTLKDRIILSYPVNGKSRQIALAFYDGKYGRKLLAREYVCKADTMAKADDVNVPIRVRKIPEREREILERLLKEEFPRHEYPAGLCIF